MKTFAIKIPAGIHDNEKIRLIGQGKKGENGGNSGDLLIRINIEKDSRFILQGNNLYTDLKLSPWEAALGTKVNIDGIDGQETVYVQKGVQSGDKIRISGKGYKNGKGGRGDLLLCIKIMVPPELNEEEVKIFQKLKAISNYNPRLVKKGI